MRKAGFSYWFTYVRFYAGYFFGAQKTAAART